MRFHSLITFLTLAALCGCRVDQKKEVRLYRDVLGGPATVPAAAENEPLTLSAALAAANLHNEQLALRGEDYVQALIDKDRAAAAFLPTLSLGATYLREESAADSRRDRFDVPLRATGNLFNGFSDLANRRRAARTVEARRALLLDLQATILLDVARAYYQVLRLEGQVRVLENTARVQSERVRDAQTRQQAGLARPLDVAQSQAQASGTRVSLLAAQSETRNARTALAYLTALSVGDRPLVDDFVVPADLPALEQWLTDARAYRQDIAAAGSRIAAARQGVQVAVGRYYPSVDLDLNVFLRRQSVPAESDWNALLSVNLPIFSAGLIHADVRLAWSEFRQAMLEELQTLRSAERDVQVSLENLLSSDRQIAELHTQVAAAEESVRQAEQSIPAGFATNLDLLVAQDRLLAAQLDLTTEQFNRKVFYLDLLRAAGKLGLR